MDAPPPHGLRQTSRAKRRTGHSRRDAPMRRKKSIKISRAQKNNNITDFYSIWNGPFCIKLTTTENAKPLKVVLMTKVFDEESNTYLPGKSLMTINKPRQVFLGPKQPSGLPSKFGASVLIQLANNDIIHVFGESVCRISLNEEIDNYYNDIHGTQVYPHATTRTQKMIDFMGSKSTLLHSDPEGLKYINNSEHNFYEWSSRNEDKGKELVDTIIFTEVNGKIFNAKEFTQYLSKKT